MQTSTSHQAKVLESIYYAIDELNADWPADRPKIAKDPQTVLYGRAGALDSLALVNLIAAVEDRLAQNHGLRVKLDDDQAVAQPASPFKTVQSLAAYISGRLQ